MMSDPRRRRSPESARRRRKSRRASSEHDHAILAEPPATTFASSAGPPPATAFSTMTMPVPTAEPAPRAPPSALPIPADLNRPRRVRRHRSQSSLGSSSASCSSGSGSGSGSSSSYLDISRWYPSWGRGGGVLKTFFHTPSEHRPRRRRSQRKMHKKSSKKTKGVFVFGSHNSSSSSVNSDMAYGMGFIKKPKSRGGKFSPNIHVAARPAVQRRQTDEEILEIGRKLQDVARMQNRADLDRRGQSSWDTYQRHSSSGVQVSSRGLGPSKHGRRRHRHAASSDDEWESASDGGEDSDGLSGLAYGHTPIPTPQPAKSFTSRMSTASAIAAGSALVAGSAIAASRAPEKKSAVVDPKLFGPTNSLRDFVNTPCGFNNGGGGAHAYSSLGPGQEVPGYAGSAESASVESRPLQRVFPLQTSDPGHMEAARASGSIVSSQQSYSSLVRDRVYSTTSISNRPEPVPIQAPKPIAPLPSRIYDDERIRDIVPPEPVEHRRKPTSDNKIYAETALVGAGVAALGAAILAGRDKGKGKEHDPEPKHGKHERYGHDDHRQDDTKVEDARKAQELRLMQEIERLETALGRTSRAREQRKRDSKRDRDSVSYTDTPTDERRKTEINVEKDKDHERERPRRRRESKSQQEEPSNYDGKVSDPSERPALVQDDNSYRRVDGHGQHETKAPIDVFQFQVPDDTFTTRSSPPRRPPSPYIIDVTPSPSPAPGQDRSSRRSSLADETRDAHRIYEEAHHSTAPIPEAVMAAAIGAVVHSRRHHDHGEEQGRGRTNARTADTIQEEANKVYAARRVAEREIRSRSRSRSQDKTAARVPRIVTPPEMQNRPPKNPFSGANADFRFDMEMSPTQLLGYWPEVAPVRDPSAERPRPVLNLVMPTPVPTPDPETQRKAPVKEPEPEPVENLKKEMPSMVFGPRGEVVEVMEVVEEPPTPSTSKRVSWGPSETKQYEEHSPERPREHSASSSEKPAKGFGGWGAIAAAVAGAGVGAAVARDNEPKSPRRDERSRDEYASGSCSPPKERRVLSTGMSSRVLTEEPEELPPAPGPKPASPRHSQQMPGAFGDDIDFAATLAAGLEHSGFDPEIVIANPEYHRRDSPPGSNEPYTEPFAETVSDLGIHNIDDGYGSLSHEHGYVIGEVNTPGSEKAVRLEDFDDVSRGTSREDKTSSSVYDDIEVIEEPGETGEADTWNISNKERRKLEKAAQAARVAEKDAQAAQPEREPVEVGEDEWDAAPTSKKSKKSNKKAKRSSVAWDDADTPVNDTAISVPVNAFDDIEGTRSVDTIDDWDVPKKSKKPKRDSKGYDLPGDVPPDKEKRDRRRTEFYEPVDRDVASVVSDSRYDERSTGYSNGGDDDRSVVSAPSSSKPDSNKRSSGGGFWGLLGGKDQQQSKKDNAGTLGVGVGLAGVAAVATAAAVTGSDAAEAPWGQQQQEPHVRRDVGQVEVFEDPEVAPRVIKPAIDPQYGDLLPLPPSPGESSLEFDDEDALPALPDSRPTTPPGQAPAIVRDRESSMKRPHFAAGHIRRTSTAEPPPRSPSHTAIPIQFRMGHRSMSATSPAMGSRSSPVVQSPTPPALESPPMLKRNEFSPTFKRHPSRPTSWDSSREIKPLYLLERSARPADEAEQRDEWAEMTPLPPSKESLVPEDELEHGKPVGLGVAPGSLMIDTDVAYSATDYASQEPTSTTPKPIEQLSSVVQEVEATFLGLPSSSPLPESSYATPGEFPREMEVASSPQLEPLPSEAPVDQEVDKPDNKSYFPSALSILPAATLAGVGVLLGRGKKEEAHATVDNHNSKAAVDEPLPQAVEPLSKASIDLPYASGQGDRTRPTEAEVFEVGSIVKSNPHQHVPDSQISEAVDLQSPVNFQDAQTELPTATSLDSQPEAIEASPQEPIGMTDWAAEKGPAKKKKKGKKKKQSVSDAPPLVVAAEQSNPSSSLSQQDLPSQDDADLETTEEPLFAAAPSRAPTAAQQSQSDSPEAIVTEQSALEQLSPPQPDIIDVAVERQLEHARDLDAGGQEMHDNMYPSLSDRHHEPAHSPPEMTSEDVLTQAPHQEADAGIPPAIEQPNPTQSEAFGDTGDVADPAVGSSHVQGPDIVTASSPTKVGPVEEDWATPLPNKRKSNKKSRQSVSFADVTTDSLVATSPVQELGLQQDPSSAMEVSEPSLEQLHESFEGPLQPLEPESIYDDISQQKATGPQDMIEKPAILDPSDMQKNEPSQDIPAEKVPTSPKVQNEESEPDVSQFPVEAPTAMSSEHQGNRLEEAALIPVAAEEELPIISEMSKNNKKRKSSKAINEPVQSLANAASAELEHVEASVQLPPRSASAAEEDIEPAMLSSESKEIAITPEDVETLDRDTARNHLPPDVAVESTGALADQSLSVQRDNQLELQTLETERIASSPKSAPLDAEAELIPEHIEPVDTRLESIHGMVASEPLKPEGVSTETIQPGESLTEPTALPDQDDLPINVTSADIHSSSLELPNLETLDVAGDLGRETDTSATGPEQSEIQQQEDFDKLFDEGDAARRGAEAAQISEEEAEFARLQLKRKPSKKDKSRLKDLKARAQQRAEEAKAEAVTSSSDSAKGLEQPAQEPEMTLASHVTEIQPTEATAVEEPIFAEQSNQAAVILENQESVAPWDAPQPAEQDVGKSSSTDENAPDPEIRHFEDPVELARREAEAEQIRDEERELTRLKIKRKPSKKDKNRIKALEANAEEREREAEAAAQRQVDQQTAASRGYQDEVQAHADAGLDFVTDPAEEVSQPPSGLEVLENDIQHQGDTSVGLVSGVNAPDMDSRTRSDVQIPGLDQSEAQLAQDAKVCPVASKQENRQEHHGDADHEATTQEEKAANSNQENVDTLPSNENARDIVGHSPSSPDRSKSKFGGWGMIAAAVTGASVGAALGKDHEPRQIQESQILSGDDSAEANDDTPNLDSQAGAVQETPSQSSLHADNQSHTEVKDAESHEEVLPAEMADTSPAHFEEPDPLTEPTQQDNDTTSIPHDLDPDQSATAEIQVDSEWFSPSKKSKKDKKKKRKGTLSGDNGQSSGLATPLEASEPVSVPETAEVGDVGAATSQQEDILPIAESDVVSIDQIEMPHLEQHDSAFAMTPSDDLEEKVAPSSALEGVIADTRGDQNPNVDNSGQSPNINVTNTADVAESESPRFEPEHNAPLEEVMDLPPILRQSAEAAPSPVEAAQDATKSEPALDYQYLPQDIEVQESGSRQLVSSVNELVSATAAAQDVSPLNQDTIPSIETSGDVPLGTEPSTLTVDETQQHQDDEFSWAPAKKKDKKKKKKRGSAAWSEPPSGPQTPITEEIPERITQDTSQEASNLGQSSLREDDLIESRDSEPQIYDWYANTSPKKKKKNKQKQASVSSWEPESSSHAALDDEPREVHDVAEEAVESFGDTDVATPPAKPIQSIESLQQESASVPEPDLTAGQDGESLPRQIESTDQLPFEATPKAGAVEDFARDEYVPEQGLESKINEGEDTLIVGGGDALGDAFPLTGEAADSHPPLNASQPPTITEDSYPSEAVPQPDPDSQIKSVDDGTIAVEDGPAISEHGVDLPSFNEPIYEWNLLDSIDNGEDTLAVGGERVDTEVSEPWSFEATHDSTSFTKSDSNADAKYEDGENAQAAGGEKHPDEFLRPSHTQDYSHDKSQQMTESTSGFLDVNRPASRPQSPAPWGEEDYTSAQRDTDLDAGQHVAVCVSPDRLGGDASSSTGQNDDFLDDQHSDTRPESPALSDDNQSAFVTPSEDAPIVVAEPYPILSPDTHEVEEEPFEWMPTNRSEDDERSERTASISRPMSLAPESSDPVPETSQFDQALEQQSFTKLIESPGANDPAVDKGVEPGTENFSDWAPKKLTKKERRKAKKSSMSISDSEVSPKSFENSQVDLVAESENQTSTADANFGNVQQDESSQSTFGHLIQPREDDEPTSHSIDVDDYPTHRPDSPGPDFVDESSEAAGRRQSETSAERQTETSYSVAEEAGVAAVVAAAAAAVPVLTRKMSKKDRRKAKKASSSWEDDALEQPQASTAEDTIQSKTAPILASQTEDPRLTRDAALDTPPTKLQPDQEIPTQFETTSAAEAVADDEWAVPLSRKKAKGKKKKGKQLSVESASGTETPTVEEPPIPASAEAKQSPKLAYVPIEETLAQETENVSVPKSPLWPPNAAISEASHGAHLEAKSPATLGTDLQKIPSAAPSPDPWENEDYFKPKSPGGSTVDPPEEPFEKLEIHPAFTRGLNSTTLENRSREERPLVGLGLIHRHSSIFQEDDGHTPKLLTLTSDNASIESLVIEEGSQPGASMETYRVPESRDGGKLRAQSVEAGSKTPIAINTDLDQQADMSPAPEAATPSSSAHPQRRFPLSPRLSPRPAPEDPPKSPIPDEIKLSQRGSVAMLAQRFGGKRKKVPKYVDKRAPVKDDIFDDSAMWEGAERKALDGSRVDEDGGDFWAVEDTTLDKETFEPDVHPGQGSTSLTHGMGTQHGDDNVSATHSQPGPDAGRFTPELSEKTTRQEEVPLEPMVESPVLGSQASVEFPSPEPQRTIHSPSSRPDVEASQTTHQPTNIADIWSLVGARHHRDDLPCALSGSPPLDSTAGLEESVLPPIELEYGQSRESFAPSASRGLPPVQEEPLEEEADSGKHAASLSATTPDINRDSGFVTDSPNQAWTRRFDDAQQRDSGVHMHDYRDKSPGLHSSRGGSPDTQWVSRSSVEKEGARQEEKPKRSPLAKYERRLREDTPVLEAQEAPVTPEPQKHRSDGSRTHKYPDLGPGATAAAVAGGAALLATPKSGAIPLSLSAAEGERSVSESSADKIRKTGGSPRRAVSNTRMSRAKTPEPLTLRPDSPSLLRHSGTPPLRSRRTRSGDLRTLSQSRSRSHSELGAGVGAPGSPSPSSALSQTSGRAPTPAAAAKNPVPASSSSSSDLRRATTPAAAAAATSPTTTHPSTANPVANEGRVRSKDMADVYDGFGEGRLGSPRSPTRPHSMRRRQSMQVLDLENRVEQLMAENRALAEAKTLAELHSANRVTSSLAERDNEIEALKQSLDFMRKEIHRLTEVNEGLNSAISQSAVQHQDRYRILETQHAAAAGELDSFRSKHGSHAQTIEAKDAEIRNLREQLEATKEQVREMQRQILATNPADSDFLQIKDVDYFDHRCQQLCSHVQQWVLRFSKFSDMRACRLATELNDEKIIDRLDNAVLDGSNVDSYLNDRVRRRDVFMSVAMTMIWEFVFTRYLFGMDREQRQKLKALEKLLLEVGPPKAVRQWRAVTLTLLSKRDAFKDQREQDTEAVVQAVFQTLSMILPPPSNLEDQIQGQLRKVLREAVDLSIEMRTQRAEYMMLPPLQPEYDASGDLAEPHPFNAQLMSERSGDKSNDDDLQAEGAIVRVVLFPLVVKKGDDEGVGDDEVVVCPAQVIVKKPRSSSRRSMRAPSSDAGGVSLLRGGSPSTAPNKSNVSMAEAEYIEGGI